MSADIQLHYQSWIRCSLLSSSEATMETLVTLDTSDLEISSPPSPVAEILYSDISEDDVPPPPTIPHPDVIRRCGELSERPQYEFASPTTPVPSALISLVHRDCTKKIPVLIQKLQDVASRVGDIETFRSMLTDHRREITILIRIVRSTAVRYLKNSEATKSQLDSIKFSLFKRLAVWRDQIDNLSILAGRHSGWSEERRQMLWRRLEVACRWRMIGFQIRETNRDEDIVQIDHD